MKNRFGKLVGFFDPKLQGACAFCMHDWNLKAILSFVAYTDNPEPGEYWGEAALLCYAPEHEQIPPSFKTRRRASPTACDRVSLD